MSSFEYSLIIWKCGGRSPTVWFTQNGWANVVDSTADFLNSAQLPPFVRVTGSDWFCTKSLLTKRLHACAVCRCKTIFPLVGSTKLKNNVSKMLIVKNQTVIDCLQLSNTKGVFIATQLNSTELNSTAWTTVDSVCRLWRHKQKHDWLGCTLFNWVSWVELSWVEFSSVEFSWVVLL